MRMVCVILLSILFLMDRIGDYVTEVFEFYKSIIFNILSCKSMTELVKGSALNASTSIITSNQQVKRVFGELFSMFRAEEIWK